MRTTELIHLTAHAPFSVKASSIVLAAILFIALATPVVILGAGVVA